MSLKCPHGVPNLNKKTTTELLQNFTNNKILYLYRSSYKYTFLRDKEEKLYWNILENPGGIFYHSIM